MPACMSVGELSSGLSLGMHASLSVSRPTVRLSACVCLSVSVCLFIGLLFSKSLIDSSFVRMAVYLFGCLIVSLTFQICKAKCYIFFNGQSN